MINPERIEKLEADVSNIFDFISSFNEQLRDMKSNLLANERFAAELGIRHQTLWALWKLIPPSDNAANVCVQYIRENASSAITEIRHSSNPTEVHSQWYKKCKAYFEKQGVSDVF